MEKLKLMFKSTAVRKVVPAIALVAVSGAAMAAEGTAGAAAFDMAAFADPIVNAVTTAMTYILTSAAVVMAAVFGPKLAIRIFKSVINRSV